MSEMKDINKQFNHAVHRKPTTSDPIVTPVAMPVSKQQIGEMQSQVPPPIVTVDFTPMGTVTKTTQTQEAQATLKKVEEMRNRLGARRNAAKEAFGRAHDDRTVKKGRRM